ncbi:MAG: NUDIX hydrolase [Halanaerobiales bacterium]
MKVKSLVENYIPVNEQEEKDKELFLTCFDSFDDILYRDNPVAHLTSSGFVVNKSRDSVLMIYHNIYDSWAWTGGHADGEQDLLHVALKEAREETGVKKVKPLSENIVSLDVIPVLGHEKNGEYVSPHLHLSVAYLIEADERESLSIKPDENSGVKWIPLGEIAKYSDEKHILYIYDKIISRLKLL